MAYFTVFQDRLFPTAELPKGEREKIEELKEIFENEDINVLNTLEFKYKKKIIKKKIPKNLKNTKIKKHKLMRMHFFYWGERRRRN